MRTAWRFDCRTSIAEEPAPLEHRTFFLFASRGPALGVRDGRFRRSIRESFAGKRLTKLLTAPHSRGGGLTACASDILLVPMFLEALTLHRVITLPTELSARSTALVLEWDLDINNPYPHSLEAAKLVNSTVG